MAFTAFAMPQYLVPSNSVSHSGTVEACSPAALPSTIMSRPLNLISAPTPDRAPLQPLPTTLNGSTTKSAQLPTQGLLIPNIPVRLPNGGHSRKDESWRIIVDHWLHGDAPRGLHTPLKDWPRAWLQGPNKIFAQKHFDRSIIALEFIKT